MRRFRTGTRVCPTAVVPADAAPRTARAHDPPGRAGLRIGPLALCPPPPPGGIAMKITDRTPALGDDDRAELDALAGQFAGWAFWRGDAGSYHAGLAGDHTVTV